MFAAYCCANVRQAVTKRCPLRRPRPRTTHALLLPRSYSPHTRCIRRPLLASLVALNCSLLYSIWVRFSAMRMQRAAQLGARIGPRCSCALPVVCWHPCCARSRASQWLEFVQSTNCLWFSNCVLCIYSTVCCGFSRSSRRQSQQQHPVHDAGRQRYGSAWAFW